MPNEPPVRDPQAGNAFSGQAGAAVQAGHVYGGVHLQLRRATALPAPRQLPPASGHFINRELQLGRLDELLEMRVAGPLSDPGTAVISTVSGAAGVGKTTLALQWAHRVRHRFPDGDLYVDLRGHAALPPAEPARVLEDFLRALNVPPGKLPTTIDAMSALYRSLLAERRLLIVLDNASTAAQVRPLLPGSSRSMVVVTSRNRLSGLVTREGAIRVSLDTLSTEDSLALLRESIGRERVDNELEAATQIIQLCSFLPLALRIVADRASLRPHEPLRGLMDELMRERHLLDAFVTDDDELSEVRTVLSWSYRSLKPPAARLFRLMGMHPGPELAVGAAAALGGLDDRQAGNLLDSINAIHMVDRVASGRYRLHDLVKAYASERAEAECDEADRSEATRRMLAWYLARAYASYRVILPQGRPIEIGSLAASLHPEGFSDTGEALAWCDLERENVLACVSQAEAQGEFELAWKLALSFMGYLERRSYWSHWIESHDIAIRSARVIGDQAAEAFALMLQADAFWDRHDFDEAMLRYTRSIEVSRSAGDRWTEGFALRGCGLTHQELGAYQEAAEYSRAALAIFEQIGEVRGRGMTLLSLGNAHRELADLPSATTHYEAAIEVFSALGNEWSVGLTRYHAGIAYARLPDPDAALSAFDEARRIFRALDDRRHEAWVLRDMASCLEALYGPEAAYRARRQALDTLTLLGDPEADDLRPLVEPSLPEPPPPQ